MTKKVKFYLQQAELKHVGVLGMHWGRRMARDGSVTTLRRGKRVPMMTTHQGKPVQVNGRAVSNSIRSKLHGSKPMQTKESLRTVNGKPQIVTKTKFGDVVASRAVSHKEASDFVEAKKQEKIASLYKDKQRKERIAKVASAIIITYSAVSIASMLNPHFIPSAAQKLAWATGKVISNSPIG